MDESLILEAQELTEIENQRINSYKELRYSFYPGNSNAYFERQYDEVSRRWAPFPEPTEKGVRKALGVNLWARLKTIFSEDAKKELDAKIRKEIKCQQDDLPRVNSIREKQFERYWGKTREKKSNFLNGDAQEVQEFLKTVIDENSFSLDSEHLFQQCFDLEYIANEKKLVIAYRLPSVDEVPNIASWKVDKEHRVIPVAMKKKDFNLMYEDIIFDLAMRLIGIVFRSDIYEMISEIVFTGYVSFVSNGCENPIYILSVAVTRSIYEKGAARSIHFRSKPFFAKISDANSIRYIGKIESETPPQSLVKIPPEYSIEPIQRPFI